MVGGTDSQVSPFEILMYRSRVKLLNYVINKHPHWSCDQGHGGEMLLTVYRWPFTCDEGLCWAAVHLSVLAIFVPWELSCISGHQLLEASQCGFWNWDPKQEDCSEYQPQDSSSSSPNSGLVEGRIGGALVVGKERFIFLFSFLQQRWENNIL